MLRELTERARTGGLKLTGEGGLLGKLTKMVVEGALEGELDDHLGYSKHDPAVRDGRRFRDGPPRQDRDHRDRAAGALGAAGPGFQSEPKIVAEGAAAFIGVDEMVISLSAKGLTHGEIAAHLAEVYGAEVSKQTITAITDRVMEGLAEWQSRPLDSVYAVILIDAINVKIREGQVANLPDLPRPGRHRRRGARRAGPVGRRARRRGRSEIPAVGSARKSRTAVWPMCACWSATG